MLVRQAEEELMIIPSCRETTEEGSDSRGTAENSRKCKRSDEGDEAEQELFFFL